jgi:hypothetical protein
MSADVRTHTDDHRARAAAADSAVARCAVFCPSVGPRSPCSLSLVAVCRCVYAELLDVSVHAAPRCAVVFDACVRGGTVCLRWRMLTGFLTACSLGCVLVRSSLLCAQLGRMGPRPRHARKRDGVVAGEQRSDGSKHRRASACKAVRGMALCLADRRPSPWHARNSLHRMLAGSVLMLVHSVLCFPLLCQSSMTLRSKEHVARTTSQRPSQSPPSHALAAAHNGALGCVTYGMEGTPVISDARQWWPR